MSSFFSYKEAIGLVTVFLFCFMFILFDYEDIENSNLKTALIELIIGLSVAGWFFRRQNKQQKKIDEMISQQDEFRKIKLDSILTLIFVTLIEIEDKCDKYVKSFSMYDARGIGNNQGTKIMHDRLRKLLRSLDEVVERDFDWLLPDLVAKTSIVRLNCSAILDIDIVHNVDSDKYLKPQKYLDRFIINSINLIVLEYEKLSIKIPDFFTKWSIEIKNKIHKKEYK